jgi:hypothetical protein
MKRTLAAAMLLLGAAARAAAPVTAAKAKERELRAEVRDEKHKLKQAALDQHKELALVREREKSDVSLVKASAARPETIHEGLLEVHEKSMRDRRAVRARRREDRERLRREIKDERAELTVLRKMK